VDKKDIVNIRKLINQEIRWCATRKEQQADLSIPLEFANGFIAGLKQARMLINKVVNI
jgi:hypothetical protein